MQHQQVVRACVRVLNAHHSGDGVFDPEKYMGIRAITHAVEQLVDLSRVETPQWTVGVCIGKELGRTGTLVVKPDVNHYQLTRPASDADIESIPTPTATSRIRHRKTTSRRRSRIVILPLDDALVFPPAMRDTALVRLRGRMAEKKRLRLEDAQPQDAQPPQDAQVVADLQLPAPEAIDPPPLALLADVAENVDRLPIADPQPPIVESPPPPLPDLSDHAGWRKIWAEATRRNAAAAWITTAERLDAQRSEMLQRHRREVDAHNTGRLEIIAQHTEISRQILTFLV